MATGQTEVFLQWPDNIDGTGGDFALDDTGDLMLAIDTPNNPIATEQRIIRLLLTNLQDDPCNPSWGVGLSGLVDSNFTANSVHQITALISNWLSQDSGVAQSPAPVIKVALAQNNTTCTISIQFNTPTGSVVILPDLALTSGQ